MVVTPHCGDHSLSVEKAADEISATGGPRRLSPVDVNDVLYRLSHATVYINYDGYATYSMTFKPKAKVGLMTAGWTSCFHDGMPLAFFC